MQQFLLAHNDASDWQTAVSNALSQLDPIPAEASLGFVYVSEQHAAHFADMVRRLQEETGVPHWVGTIGSALCATNTEYFDQAALVVLVTDIPQQQFHVFNSSQSLPELADGETVHVAAVHADPRNGQLAKLIEQLPDKIGNGYLVGGLSSSQTHFHQYADNLCEGDVSGVIFDGEVPIITGLSQGCSPVGPIHTLTESDSNIAITIDHRPALDVMKEDIGEILARDLNRIGGYIFAGFPVADSDTGDYLVRNLLGIDPESGALALGEYLEDGRSIMFCKRDGLTAVEDLQRMVNKLKQRAAQQIKGALYFTCLGRGQHMFGEPHRELELISEILGDIPLAGFYANGEIAGNRLYGYTGVLTLFL
ncbi:MAG: FIST C-terminal domain-containing protein [Gammaproteobacteria bacterium]